jgi:hypothetical protein
LVSTPSSTRVIVSLPNLRTVTLGACALAEDPGEVGDGEPVVEAAGVGVDAPDAVVALVVLAPAALEGGASLVTETVVRRPFWSMVVVCVPSSTLVIVSLPNLRTVTLGACAPAGADEGAPVEEAGEAGVAEAGVEEAGGAGVAEAGVVEAAGVEAAGVVAGALEVVAEALELAARGGGGDGSAPAVPAGVAAVLAWAPVCPGSNCGRSLSVSPRWLSACNGWPVLRSTIPPRMSPTAFMLDGRTESASWPTSLPGSAATEAISETMLPMLNPMMILLSRS